MISKKVPAFVCLVAGVQQVFKFRIYLEPAVCISVFLVTDSVGLFLALACRGIDDGSRHGNAFLLHDEAAWVIDVRGYGWITAV